MVCGLVYCHREVSQDCSSQSNFFVLSHLMLKLPPVVCNPDLASVSLAECNISSNSTKTFKFTPVNAYTTCFNTKNYALYGHNIYALCTMLVINNVYIPK